MVDRRRRVVWTDQATSALDEIVAFIARDSAQAARAFLDEALGAASGLATLSARGRVVPELEDHSIREIFFHRYRLLYEVRVDKVVILAILHGARDFSRWRKST